MKHLLIIFLLGTSIYLQSCKSSEIDSVGKIGYFFHNKSGQLVELKSFDLHGNSFQFQIQNGGTLFHEYVGWISTSSQGESSNYHIADILLDSLIINFNSERNVIYKNNFSNNDNFCSSNPDSRSLYCLENYSVKTGSGYYEQYHYFFTEQDYENAG